MLKYFFIWTNK